MPTFAQEQNAVDPEVRQQIEAVLIKFDEAHNKGDPTAMAALYTQDAAQMLMGVMGTGTCSGQQAIEKSYAAEFASKSSRMCR